MKLPYACVLSVWLPKLHFHWPWLKPRLISREPLVARRFPGAHFTRVITPHLWAYSLTLGSITPCIYYNFICAFSKLSYASLVGKMHARKHRARDRHTNRGRSNSLICFWERSFRLGYPQQWPKAGIVSSRASGYSVEKEFVNLVRKTIRSPRKTLGERG